MALTIPDIILAANAPYVNIYNQANIAPGTSLLLQNKSNTAMYVQITQKQPNKNSTDGTMLDNNIFLEVSGEELPAVWVKGAGRLSVQILD